MKKEDSKAKDREIGERERERERGEKEDSKSERGEERAGTLFAGAENHSLSTLSWNGLDCLCEEDRHEASRTGGECLCLSFFSPLCPVSRLALALSLLSASCSRPSPPPQGWPCPVFLQIASLNFAGRPDRDLRACGCARKLHNRLLVEHTAYHL